MKKMTPETLDSPLVLRYEYRGLRKDRVVQVQAYEADADTYEVLLDGEPGMFVRAKERRLAFGPARQYQPSNMERQWYADLQTAIERGVKKMQREGNL
jgi:hypothetical protein